MSPEDASALDPDSFDSSPDEPSPSRRSRWRRALDWAKANRRKALLLVGASVASVVGVVVLTVVLWLAAQDEPELVTLEMALAALDRGSLVQAQEYAEKLREQETLAPTEWGGPAFVLGAAAAYEARETWAKDRANRYLLAAGYLDEARTRGFPPGRRAVGLLLLGEGLYHSGQIAACRPVLLEALAANPDKQSRIDEMLASAYLEDANPKLEEALKYNSRLLEDRYLTEAQRETGLLRQAEIQLRMGKVAECRKTLERIPSHSRCHAGAVVLEGRILMRQAEHLADGGGTPHGLSQEALQTYDKAIKLLRSAQGQDTLSIQATRKAQYLIGVCFLQMGDYRAAMNQFERTRITYAGTPEAQAASFEEAELARLLGQDNEALAAYRRALRSVRDPKSFSNPWISLDDLRAKVFEAYESYLDRERFDLALHLLDDFCPLFPAAKKALWTAETCERWGKSLAARAEHLPYEQRQPLLKKARSQFRRAGRAYQELAALETTTRRYTEHLWNSAEDYLAGHDFRDAAVVLKEHLKNETKLRHSLALLKLGEALLALDRVEEALTALKDCVDFHPKDAAAYRARLLASRAYVEKGELEKAEKLLADNLNGVLSPASQEWRQSLFEVGHLKHIQGEYAEAVNRLGEAIRRYPDAPEALEARYLIADSHRRMAEQSQRELRASLVRNVRLSRSKQIQALLLKALEEYREIQEILAERQQVASLTPEEKAILRNTFFAAGETQFDLGKYGEAVRTYTTAAYRYQSDPAALLAYLQIAAAYERLQKTEDARNTLKQAKVVLGRIQADDSFTRSTPFTRSQWEQLLDERLREL